MTNPITVIERFHAAEADYMNAGGATAGADFTAMAATLDPQVVLRQSPDLPWGATTAATTATSAGRAR